VIGTPRLVWHGLQFLLGLLVLVIGLWGIAMLIHQQEWKWLTIFAVIAIGIIGMVWFDDRFGGSRFVVRFEALCYIIGITFFTGLGASLLFNWLYS